MVPPPSCPVSVAAPTMPTLQIPSPPLSSSIPLMPHLDTPESNSNSNSNLTTNLVKPSSFTVPPSSSAIMIPLVSSSMPSAPPLHNLQRPYGAPLLQPFPPPTPPPSLAPSPIPTPNYGPVINRDKVRDALLVLVQVSLFSYMTLVAVVKFFVNYQNSHVLCLHEIIKLLWLLIDHHKFATWNFECFLDILHGRMWTFEVK